MVDQVDAKNSVLRFKNTKNTEGEFEECSLENGIDAKLDQTALSHTSSGYVLGIPFEDPNSWTLLKNCLDRENIELDPHYTFFGCNTESQVNS